MLTETIVGIALAFELLKTFTGAFQRRYGRGKRLMYLTIFFTIVTLVAECLSVWRLLSPLNEWLDRCEFDDNTKDQILSNKELLYEFRGYQIGALIVASLPVLIIMLLQLFAGGRPEERLPEKLFTYPIILIETAVFVIGFTLLDDLKAEDFGSPDLVCNLLGEDGYYFGPAFDSFNGYIGIVALILLCIMGYHINKRLNMHTKRLADPTTPAWEPKHKGGWWMFKAVLFIWWLASFTMFGLFVFLYITDYLTYRAEPGSVWYDPKATVATPVLNGIVMISSLSVLSEVALIFSVFTN